MGEVVGGMARRWEGTAAEQAAFCHQPCPQSPWQPPGAAWLPSQKTTPHLLGGQMCHVVEICLLISTWHQVISCVIPAESLSAVFTQSCPWLQEDHTSTCWPTQAPQPYQLSAVSLGFSHTPVLGFSHTPVCTGCTDKLLWVFCYSGQQSSRFSLVPNPSVKSGQKVCILPQGAAVALVVGHKEWAAPQQDLPVLCLSSGLSIFAAFSVIMSRAGERA